MIVALIPTKAIPRVSAHIPMNEDVQFCAWCLQELVQPKLEVGLVGCMANYDEEGCTNTSDIKRNTIFEPYLLTGISLKLNQTTIVTARIIKISTRPDRIILNCPINIS